MKPIKIEGLFFIPIKNFKPIVDWKGCMSVAEYKWRDADGAALITGSRSGGLEVLDVDVKNDDEGTLKKLIDEIIEKYFSDVNFLKIETRSGGYHFIYRTEVVLGNTKLAHNSTGKVILETRGEGGLIFTIPAEGYSIISGSFDDIPVLDAERRDMLFSMCRAFNKVTVETDSENCFQAFNKRHTCADILQRYGWEYVESNSKFDYWRRPGKSKDISGSINKHGFFYCFTSSTEMEPDKGYDAVGIEIACRFRGDKSEAARVLYSEGYGNQVRKVGINVVNCENRSDSGDCDDIFWKRKENGGIVVIRYTIKKWLQLKGFYGYKIDGRSWCLVRINNKVIEETNSACIKNFTLKYLESKELYDVYEHFSNKENHIFSEGFMETLDFVNDLDGFYIMRDTVSHSFKPYKNCSIIIDAEGIKKIDHSDLYGYIWKSHILERDYSTDNTKGIYETFIENVMDKNEERIISIRSIIGYLLHTYKDNSYCPAIIINDEIINEDTAEGGTGKGIFFNAIAQLVNVLKIDGKNFSFDKNFIWNRVSMDTQLIFFDDVGRYFNFERLFSTITEGLNVEKKGKDEFYIKFEESPKIGITTNYTINGSGTSFDRRRVEVEFSKYYDCNKTPQSEFGCILFKTWKEIEWVRFDTFMIDCIQLYLKNGVIKPETKYYQYKKVLNEIGRDVYNYFESLSVCESYNVNFIQTEIRSITDKKTSVQLTKKMLRTYSVYKKYDFTEYMHNKVNYVKLTPLTGSRIDENVVEDEIKLEF